MAVAAPEAPATTDASTSTEAPKYDLDDKGRRKVWLSKTPHHTLTLNLPDPIRDEIRADAAKRPGATAGKMGTTDNAVVREIIADHYNWYIVDNVATRTGDYAGLTKEEKAAKVAQERQNARARVDAVLSAITAGLIPEDVLLKMGLDKDGNPLAQAPSNGATAPA